MKVLVVSCDTGGGHNAAAQAVCENLTAHGHSACFLELYELRSHRLTRYSSSLYTWSTRRSPVFGSIYKVGDRLSRRLQGSKGKSVVYHFNDISSQKLARYLHDGGYEAVVATHLFAAEALTALRLRGQACMPLIAVETDYTCIPFWHETAMDRYLIPHPDCLDDFLDHGLPFDKVLPWGIPVSAAFSAPKETHEGARQAVRERYGFRSDQPLFVVMSGSMGYGHLEGLVRALVDDGGSSVVVGCGHNEALQGKLCGLYRDEPRVAVEGYMDDPARYMRAADVCLTKPGGLTSTEAAVLGVALVHTTPIPGCEEHNARFFLERGLSRTGMTVEDQALAAYTLAGHPQQRATMVEAQKRVIPPDAAERLRGLLEGMVGSTCYRL